MAFREINLNLYKDTKRSKQVSIPTPERMPAFAQVALSAQATLDTSETDTNLWRMIYENQGPVMKGWFIAMILGLGMFSIHF